MIGIVCADKNNGLFFNNRRQSSDKMIVRDILLMSSAKKVYMTEYSFKLFDKNEFNIPTDNLYIYDDISKVAGDVYCFLERENLLTEMFSKLIVYRWDRIYPADAVLDLEKWNMISQLEFQGYSHEKIRKEVYVKDAK